MKRLCIIGLGNMGLALLGGIVESGVIDRSAILGVEKYPASAAAAAERYGIPVQADLAGIGAGDTILLAVKPQQMKDVLATLGPVAVDNLVISIAAGVTLATIAAALPGARLVRCMPNTPALVRRGVTGIYAVPAVTAGERADVERILSAVGDVVWVSSESDIDRVTALSGSGPAYVYYFIEALEDAGVRVGLTREAARRLAVGTIEGSVALMRETGEHPTILKERVTSPGGTTIYGLSALEQGGVKAAVHDAVMAAFARSKELAAS